MLRHVVRRVLLLPGHGENNFFDKAKKEKKARKGSVNEIGKEGKGREGTAHTTDINRLEVHEREKGEQ